MRSICPGAPNRRRRFLHLIPRTAHIAFTGILVALNVPRTARSPLSRSSGGAKTAENTARSLHEVLGNRTPVRTDDRAPHLLRARLTLKTSRSSSWRSVAGARHRRASRTLGFMFHHSLRTLSSGGPPCATRSPVGSGRCEAGWKPSAVPRDPRGAPRLAGQSHPLFRARSLPARVRRDTSRIGPRCRREGADHVAFMTTTCVEKYRPIEKPYEDVSRARHERLDLETHRVDEMRSPRCRARPSAPPPPPSASSTCSRARRNARRNPLVAMVEDGKSACVAVTKILMDEQSGTPCSGPPSREVHHDVRPPMLRVVSPARLASGALSPRAPAPAAPTADRPPPLAPDRRHPSNQRGVPHLPPRVTRTARADTVPPARRLRSRRVYESAPLVERRRRCCRTTASRPTLRRCRAEGLSPPSLPHASCGPERDVMAERDRVASGSVIVTHAPCSAFVSSQAYIG